MDTRRPCLCGPPGLDAHLRNVFILLLLCLRSTVFCDDAPGQLQQEPPVQDIMRICGGSGEAARNGFVSQLRSSDGASIFREVNSNGKAPTGRASCRHAA